MNLSKSQSERIHQVWKVYVSSGEKFVNASKEYTHQELDQRRLDTIPEVESWLNRFLQGSVPLEEFKTVNDGINKRNRLWGFQAINGQMFFNMVTNNSVAGNRMEELVNLLKKSIATPASLSDAKAIIKTFESFTRDLGQYSTDRRGAPKVGSIPFFLSYFWQIQQPEKYPIYYTSMVNALSELDIWLPSGDIADDYVAFYELNHEMLNLLSQQAVRKLHLWDVEHAFWFHGQVQAQAGQDVAISAKPISTKAVKDIEDDLPESYIPPIVSILPRLATNDEVLAELYRRSGRAIEKVFEERLAIIFRMLGFETQLLGQGQGRVPDGVAINHEYRYAIIYDAKVRQNSYTMGTDERAIREYIGVQGERLRKQGMRNLYFMVISSSFTGDHDDAIRSLKIDTNVNEVLLVEVKSLLAMLEGKLRNPAVSFGPDGIQRLLASSGLLTESDVREFLEI
ncbi:MAG: hypothetical protein HY327_01330 [Chloroflexi bacterium]|nr:hypothetical protein [Chloroflexota bacterium]